VPSARDIFTARPVALPSSLPLRDGTGSAGWEAQVMAIHGDAAPFDGQLRRGRRAVGLNTVQVGRNVMAVEDTGNRIFDADFGGLTGTSATEAIAAQLYSQFEDSYDFIMILLDWTENTVFAYYMPLANDVRGIGTDRLPPYRELYDDTEGNLQGTIFMNNWQAYLGQNAVLGREVFLQEIGHRWGAFVYFDKGDGPSDALLGRDLAHWSYWMQSANSALEGNDWRDNADGSFSTLTSGFRIGYSPLDRYLMGIATPEQVEPFFYIDTPDVGDARDARGARVNPASPPENAGQLRTFAGTRVDVTIEDVMAAAGSRRPSARNARREWRMATVLVLREGGTISDERLELVDQLVDTWRGLFEQETGWEMNLITALDGLEPLERVPFGASCQEAGQCDPEQATACVAVPESADKVCSHRCIAHAECGEGFCCADPADTGNAFCYPATGACVDMTPPETLPGDDVGGEDAGASNNGQEPDAGDGGTTPTPAIATGGGDGGCAQAPGRASGGTVVAASLLGLIWLGLRARR